MVHFLSFSEELKIKYIAEPFTRKMLREAIPAGDLRNPTLLIGAVDKAAVRLEILNPVKKYSGYRQVVYWFDAGNGASSGQVVWGNTTNPKLVKSGIGQSIVEYLPHPPLVFPEIIDPSKDNDEIPGSCAEANRAGCQGLNINAIMGVLVAEVVRQFLEGKLSVHYMAMDMSSFTLGAQPITDDWLETCV